MRKATFVRECNSFAPLNKRAKAVAKAVHGSISATCDFNDLRTCSNMGWQACAYIGDEAEAKPVNL